MRRIYGHIVLATLLVLAFPFRSDGQGQPPRGREGTPVTDTSSVAVRELPLPAVPPSLTLPEERAAYIIAHFWDGLDFRDTLRSRNRAFMEQNFVNYLSLFPHARQEALASPVGTLLKAAAADSLALSLVNDLAEQYLDDPASPMRNGEYYILFLEELLRLPGLSEYDRLRPAYLLETARKNRPGTTAADFAYTDRKGRRRTLHATRGKRLLLLFHDPACPHCSEVLDGLRGSAVIGRHVKSGALTVLAVCIGGDRELWDETKDTLPAEWAAAIDESGILEHGLYSLPVLPAIYLLDGDKTVILKDPVPAELEARLE